MFIFQKMLQSHSDSDSTLILEPIPADVEKDPLVPELQRTDSVIVSLFLKLHANLKVPWHLSFHCYLGFLPDSPIDT